MAAPKSPGELEALFIEKVSQKYTLNEKGLKKAFSRFDSDGSGLLSMDELKAAIQSFLYGINDRDITTLVNCYDVNGDGKVSFDEFLLFITTRSATAASAVKKIEQDVPSLSLENRGHLLGAAAGSTKTLSLPPAERRSYARLNFPPPASVPRCASSPAEEWNHYTSSDQASEVGSEIDPSNPRGVEYRAQAFLQNMRGSLIRNAASARLERTFPNQIALTEAELTEAIASSLITKAFQPYTGAEDGRARSSVALVDFSSFCKVLRAFKMPGGSSVQTEVLRFIFDACVGVMAQVVGKPFPTQTDTLSVDPRGLFFVLFPESLFRAKTLNRKPVSNPKTSVDTVGTGPVLLQPRSNSVARGPLKPNALVPPQVLLELGATTSTQVPTQSPAQPRFVSRRSRTTLSAPASFDQAALKRSSQLPAVECIREHLFGMSVDIQAGHSLHALPQTAPEYSGMRANSYVGEGQGQKAASLVYASAALVVVHDVTSRTQQLLGGHTDNVTCVALSSSGVFIAAGCVTSVGKKARVLIWDMEVARGDCLRGGDGSAGVVTAVGGEGFFERAVAAVAFSADTSLLCAVGNDDNHQLGVWSLPSGTLLAQAPALHGAPLDMAWLEWSAAKQFTQFVSREHMGRNEVFCTAGARHLRLWSLTRGDSSNHSDSKLNLGGAISGQSLSFKACVVSKSKMVPVGAPKVFACVGFSTTEDGCSDLIAGGSNGVVYQFRKGECIAAAPVIRGGISCLRIHGDLIYCGGSKGVLKLLDVRTLATRYEFSLLMSTAPPSLRSRSTSAGRLGRGSSSSGGNISSSAGAEAGLLQRHRGSASATSLGSSADVEMASTSAASSGRSRSVGRPASASGPRPGPGGAGVEAWGDVPDTRATEDSTSDVRVTGIVVVAPYSMGGAGQGVTAAQGRGTYVIATTTAGKAVRLDFKAGVNLTVSPVTRAIASRDSARGGGSLGAVNTLFHFHTGRVCGLSAEGDCSELGTMFVTAGDDRRICVWDSASKELITRTHTKSAIRCVHLDRTRSFIAAGSTGGSVHVYALQRGGPGGAEAELAASLKEVAFRKDSKQEVTHVSFSPDSLRLAVGSSDSHVYVYGSIFRMEDPAALACSLKPLHKLAGHSSYIKQLDWSADGRLLQSTCGAYELLCWDAALGRMFTACPNADIKWHTQHCVLGFSVMGIWPAYSDGSEINAVDVCRDVGGVGGSAVVATAADSGLLTVHNYPCVVKGAPGRVYAGHASHVTNVRFLNRGGGDVAVVSVGGNDASVLLWAVVPAAVN